MFIGHLDKLCDLIADHILDDILTCDPAARVAVEVNDS
ncbi:S-adenosylmethionine synthetase N-terminal domain-containing protein [Bifidobacterium bifidum]